MSGGNWSVLGLSADPVRGEPAEVRSLANASQQEAQRWEQQVQALRSAADEVGGMDMEGDFAPKFRQATQAHPTDATPLARGRADAGQALLAYASQLEQSKQQSQQALQRGQQAKQRHDQAKATYEQCVRQMNAMPKVVPYPQLAYYQQQWSMLQQQSNRAWSAMQQADQEWKAAQQTAIQAGERAVQQERAAAEKVISAANAALKAGRSNGNGSG